MKQSSAVQRIKLLTAAIIFIFTSTTNASTVQAAVLQVDKTDLMDQLQDISETLQGLQALINPTQTGQVLGVSISQTILAPIVASLSNLSSSMLGQAGGSGAPVGVDDNYEYTVTPGMGLFGVNVLDNDTDPDGDTLQLDIDEAEQGFYPPSGGAIILGANGSLLFDPDGAYDSLPAGQTEDAVITYTVTDGVNTDTAVVTITVTGIAAGGGDPNPTPTDSDNDGIPDNTDNCVNDSNANQADNDSDGIGNVCDSTPDGGGDPDPDLADPDPTPDPQDTISNYIFGHSLWWHISPDIATDEGAVSHWLRLLAEDANNQYYSDGQWGQPIQHLDNLPPSAQWGWSVNQSAWQGSFVNSNYDKVVYMPSNFEQWQGPDVPYAGDGRTAIEVASEMFEWLDDNEPGVEIVIYMHWPDMGGYGEPETISTSQYQAYHDHTRGAYRDWFVDYYNGIVASTPGVDISMVEVGPIISNVLIEHLGNQIPTDALYEDSAPHGYASIYFLSALIMYMHMYEELPPADFSMPNSIHSIIRSNYDSIVPYIWNELGNQNTPDPVDPNPTPTDSDNDGIPDNTDNCVNDSNANQADNDSDGIGNVCDSTPDGGGGGDPDPVLSEFESGDRVVTTDTVNVRDPFGLTGNILGQQIIGTAGTVINMAAQLANNFIWIPINFDSGVDGWVAETYLDAAVANASPVAVADAFSASSNATLTGVNVLANDTDADGDVLTASTPPNRPGSNGGYFNVASNGELTFDPSNPPGSFDSLEPGESVDTVALYNLSDGTDTTVGVITVTVTAPTEVDEIVIPADFPSLQSIQGLDDPSLAFGLTGPVDWSAEQPFINVMKLARPWGGYDEEAYIQLQDTVLDANGYPRFIPAGGIETFFAWDTPALRAYTEGRYVLTYDGEGDLSYFNVSIVSEEPGRVVLDIDGEFAVRIIETDPNGTGNYVRNMALVKEENLALYEAGVIFNPDFIEVVKDARQVRYMDWTHTNGSPLREWSDRNTLDTVTWTMGLNGGIPIEVQVELANIIGADPWFNIPFHASDTYIRNAAQYVRDNLDPDLKASVELSNEMWNYTFTQTHDAAAAALAAWGEGNALGWYQKQATNMGLIWRDEFGSETDDRLAVVLGGFGSIPWYTEQFMLGEWWQPHEPDQYVPAEDVFDALAVTSYFGASILGNEGEVNVEEFLAAVNDSGVDEQAWIQDFAMGLFPGQDYDDTIPGVGNLFAQHKDILDLYGLDLVLYEGGPHLQYGNPSVNGNQEVADAFRTFYRGDRMAYLYSELWDEWQASGGGPFMQFVAVSSPGFYGSWGMIETPTDTTSRAEFLVEQNEDVEAWWENRGGDHFQHGRTVTGDDTDNTLSGTNQEDILIAAGGNDVLYPGPNNDNINGGTGNDIVMLSGDQDEYTIQNEGEGYRVTGPDGSDYMYAVEVLVFADDTTQILSGDFNIGTDVIPDEPDTPTPVPTPDPVDNGSSSGGGGGGSSSSGGSGGDSSTGGVDQPIQFGGTGVGGAGSPTTFVPTQTANTTLPAADVFKRNISFNQPQINSATDVRNLEQFLNDFEGESLELDGSYGSADNEAIKRFQRKYAREILDVWGLEEATGYVGITTRLKMNFLLKGQSVQCPVFTEYHGGKADIIFSSPEIGEVQKILRDLDMYNGPVDSTWGPSVHEAMITFQETFREVMLDPWNISEGTGRQYKTTNKFLNYFAGCDTGSVELEGIGVYEGL